MHSKSVGQGVNDQASGTAAILAGRRNWGTSDAEDLSYYHLTLPEYALSRGLPCERSRRATGGFIQGSTTLWLRSGADQ
jgi:hypothetical protein